MDVMGLLKVSGEKFGQTIVLITHNPEVAQMADRPVRIEDGRIVGGAKCSAHSICTGNDSSRYDGKPDGALTTQIDSQTFIIEVFFDHDCGDCPPQEPMAVTGEALTVRVGHTLP